MKKNKFIFLAIILILSAGFFLVRNFVQASDESDAIAVRIVPNPEHYGINKWYEKQGFTGSPQALIVDGYEAIRDGRTVYVGAANLKDNLIYTNVYLISYNQSSSDKTVDILGQIIKKWKFNTDLENTSVSSLCSISSLSCQKDADCASNQFCASSGVASSSCQLETAKNCLLDSDCPDNFFCDSTKAKVIRDAKRIAMVEDLNSSLDVYKNLNGVYPKLESGTYLTNYSVSVWPSWEEEFLSGLGIKSLQDPINRLGACPGYDQITCWNKDTKKFVYGQTADLTLPAGSYGFIYRTDAKGSNYKVCSVMETKKLGYAFSPNSASFSSCVEDVGLISGGSFANTAPRLVDLYLDGEPGEEFNGSIKVVDDEGNPLTWSLDTSASSWTGWSAAPILRDTNMPNVKKVYASKAGNPGINSIKLTVSDGQGGIFSTTTPVTVINPKPFIEAEDAVFSPTSANDTVTYSFYLTDNNFVSLDKVKYSIKDVGVNDFSFTSAIGSRTFTPAGENRYKVTYQIPLDSDVSLLSDSVNNFKITAWDEYFAESTKDIKITLKAYNQNIVFNCPSTGRIFSPYSCLLGPVSQNSHTFSYSSLTALPAGLSIKTVSSQAYLSGTPTAAIDTNIVIKMTNEYSLSTSSSFPLKINSYCGDGVKQWPNTEGRGGIYNDGYESCDGEQGIATTAASSSIDFQYGCASGTGAATPYPILTNDYCIYKSPTNGGGYCGDGYCQLKVGDRQMENGCNCPSDCLGTMSCCGDGICTQTLNGEPAENACNCAQDCLGTMSCCGDGQVTGDEVCDSASTEACSGTFSEGLPSYCANIPTSGVRQCNSDCTAFGACQLSEPLFVAKTYNAGCSYGTDYPADYACCELVSCGPDNCNCCGRAEGASVSTGYTFKAGLSPCEGEHSTWEADHLPGEALSCKISQSNTNKKNWEISTNHAIARYRCWR